MLLSDIEAAATKALECDLQTTSDGVRLSRDQITAIANAIAAAIAEYDRQKTS